MADILMPVPLSAFVCDALEKEHTLHRLWKAPDEGAFLASNAADIRAIATAASILVDGRPRPIDRGFLDRFPKLELVASLGVGYDHIDAAHAASRGILVTNTPDVLTEETADTGFGLLLNTVRRFSAAERYLRDGGWRTAPFPLTASLRGRTIGILGLGRIGKALARRAEAFGLQVAYCGRTRQTGVDYPYYAAPRDLAAACDILMIAAPGGPGTKNIIDANVLKALGPDGFLINIARGSLVDEAALIDALERGAIAGAGLDVYPDEPNVDPGLLALDNVALFPHVGSGTHHTRRAMADLLLENIARWAQGATPPSLVPESRLARDGKR
ncbi:MAG: 2-hydroxyacid dehydrogenase [Beijerinckiaceae bacterium]|nr:2-hydroxyacid dehydrogenase [Beijerinckiaceae bacterium]